jgi:preprotein translocase subunit SecE
MKYSRYINLSFAAVGLIAVYVFVQATKLIFEAFQIPDTAILGEQLSLAMLIGAGLASLGTGILWRHPKVQTWSSEIAVELSKVTWPTWTETKQNTVIVLVFGVIVSSVLAVFDLFWKWVTDLILLS